MRRSLVGVLLVYASHQAVALRVDDDEDAAAVESPEQKVRDVTHKLKRESDALHDQDLLVAKGQVAKNGADQRAACTETTALNAKRAADIAKATADLAKREEQEADWASKLADKHEETAASRLDRAKARQEMATQTEKAAEEALTAGMSPNERRRWEELKTAKQFKDNHEEAEMQKRKELATKEGKKLVPSTPEEAATEVQVAELRKQEMKGEIKKLAADLARQTTKIDCATNAGKQLSKEENVLTKDVEEKTAHAKLLHEEAADAREAYFAKLQAVDSGDANACDEEADRAAKRLADKVKCKTSKVPEATTPCPLEAFEKPKA